MHQRVRLVTIAGIPIEIGVAYTLLAPGEVPRLKGIGPNFEDNVKSLQFLKRTLRTTQSL